MDPYITILIIVAALVVLGLFINKRLSELAEKQKPSNELLEYLKTTNIRLDEQGKNFNERLDNAARVISSVQKSIGEMSEIGRGMKDLQQFLQSPKLRGNVGEQVLKDLITQIFPKHSFFLQYQFKSGYKVDAAIKTSAGIIPIDSKFPMENFQKMSGSSEQKEEKFYRNEFKKDIRKHIKDISSKYILPEEGTMDFALMYIPSESVYYEVVNSRELLDLAQNLRVYPVSPTTLYSHLQTILLSFEGQKIESEARKVFTMLRAVQKDYAKVEGHISTLQSHLNRAYNKINDVVTSFTTLGQKITSTQSLGEGVKERNKELES